MSKFDRTDVYGERFKIIPTTTDQSLRISERINDITKFQRKRIIRTDHASDQAFKRKILWPDVEFVLETGKHAQTRQYEKFPNNLRWMFDGETFDGDRRLRIAVVEERDLIVVTVIDLGEEDL